MTVTPDHACGATCPRGPGNRLYGKTNNGAAEYTDGVYAWLEGFVHDIDEHGVRPPAPVVEHALARMAEIDAAEFDVAWWLTQTRPAE